MKGLRAVVMAFAMYSRLPMPRVEWTEESRSWALCAFPLVGAAVGAALFLWCRLALWLGLGPVLRGAVFTIIPLLITGGIHMDGFCDTCDALSSHQSRKKKLEIMSDPHVGTFAVLGCVLYLLLNFGLWCQFEVQRTGDLLAIACLPILSRAMSGYAAVTQPNARGSGLLAAFTQGEAGPRQKMLLLAAFLSAFLVALFGLGASCVAAAILAYWYYIRLSRREFGGLTGDLAGWFLQVCELAALAALVLAQRLMEVI